MVVEFPIKNKTKFVFQCVSNNFWIQIIICDFDYCENIGCPFGCFNLVEVNFDVAGF